MACCPQTRRWRTGRIRLPCPITACTAPSRPRRKSCCRRYSGAYRQAVPGKKPTHTGRDIHRCVGQAHDAHFNPRAPYGARPACLVSLCPQASISIHAPHTGRDVYLQLLEQGLEISIHAPHTGRDDAAPEPPRYAKNFNPRAPYGARPASPAIPVCMINDFNPRAPYGARRKSYCNSSKSQKFQSTRPIRGATPLWLLSGGVLCISIHAPHTGRDLVISMRTCTSL